VNEKLKKMLVDAYNFSAVNQATGDLAEAMFAGPSTHLKHNIGCFLVSDSQKSPCADCKKPVHVLQGISFAFAFGECPNCHAKRCLECSSKYNLEEMIMKHKNSDGKSPILYGSPCESCGSQQTSIPSPS
jgi:hypothetical protein